MANHKFTPRFIKGLKPKAADYDQYASNVRGLLVRVYVSGRKTYFVQLGRGDREKIGDANVMTVKRAEYLTRAKLNEIHDFGNVINADPAKATIGGFIEKVYAPWLQSNQRRADKTMKDLKRCFGDWYGRRLDGGLAHDDLDGYVEDRLHDGATKATIVRELNPLRRVYRNAVKGKPKYARSSPFTDWEAPRAEQRRVDRYLSDEEERSLREALADRDDKSRQERVSANDWRKEREYELLPEFSEKDFTDHLAPMVLISINTGLRYGELTALEWPAIDFHAKTLTVTGATAKGKRTRKVPLNAEALDVLTRWKAQHGGKGLIFRNADGSPIGTVKTAWLALLKGAKIEHFRWHDLRHTFASKLVIRGVALAVVRELLGHQDFNLTLRYAHLNDEQKADAVAKLAA